MKSEAMLMRYEYKPTDFGLIPVEWELLQLYEIADVKGGKRLPKGEQLSDSPTQHPYIRVTDMREGGIELSGIKYVPDSIWPTIKSYTISKDDLFISVAGTLGIVGSIPESLDGANLTENADKICNIKCSKSFLQYHLQSELIKNRIKDASTVCAQPKLAIEQIKSFPVMLPPLPEQQKIADILTTVDAHVSETEALIEKTKALKQGLMQQLLTKGIGHTEFKDTEIGRMPVEWEVKKTAEISKQLNPGMLFDKSTVKEMGIVPVLSQGVEDYVGYHDEAPGVIASDNSPVITFANHTCALRLMKTPFSCIQNIFPKIGIPGVCETIYFYYATTGKVTMTAYKGHHPLFREIKIPLPPLSEQRQIAAILTSVDDQIDTYQAKLASLTRLKTGLMQQLLTGKIRVKV
jgi:type I restriction enzyme S subunit